MRISEKKNSSEKVNNMYFKLNVKWGVKNN